MPLHRLTRITLGVPDVARTSGYYTQFGLTPRETTTADEQVLATVGGGEQLHIVETARRRLVRLGVGADNPDDLERVSASLARLRIDSTRDATSVTAFDDGIQVEVVVEIADRITQEAFHTPSYNAPGNPGRDAVRAPGNLREGPVQPRKLGHVVVGSTDQPRSERFFTEGLGFKVSDTVPGLAAFMRCSTDHHNVLVQQAPLAFLHHTAWEVDDVDEVGRGASSMLAEDPGRHVWGMGRHHVGSNFFWYLKDPAGNFSEYYSDLDCIVDDALWKPGVWEGVHGLYNWGPPPPPSFVKPDDLAAMMTGAHDGS